MELIFTLNNLDQAAVWFRQNINNNKLFAFHGEMGVGKTTFITAVCKLLGGKGDFSSPTFSIINEYALAETSAIYHIDLYRLQDEEEARVAGVEECLYSAQYCFVEWPEKAPTLFPAETIHCFFTRVDHESRKLVIIL